jgi:carboxymethylenebutenolidase
MPDGDDDVAPSPVTRGSLDMNENTLDLATADGPMDTYLVRPAGAGPWPSVIFFMDGIGVRPVLRTMAQRYAAQGYCVALPNLYFRAGRAQALDLAADHNRMYELVAGLTADQVVAATSAVLDHFDRDSAARAATVGCVGYCLGGRCALTVAGRLPQRIAAAAAIHGAQLAVDHADSPHRLAGQMRGKIYVGVAEQDPWLAPDEMNHLKAALDAGGVNYEMETYAGVAHGFAVPGLASYDAAAAERHWQRVLKLFAGAL